MSVVAGVDLDPVRPVVLTSDEDLEPAQVDFPPSIVPPTVRQGPLTLDYIWPASPEGTGLHGELRPEQRRLPLAHAWNRILSSARGSWPDQQTGQRQSRFRVAEGLGFSATRLIATVDEPEITAVVVPDALEEDAQEALLSEIRRHRLKKRGSSSKTDLLWRSMAAALVWLEFTRDQLEGIKQKHHQPIGTLLHLHLGLESFEASNLEIVPHEEQGRIWLLPGRKEASSRQRLLEVPCHLVREILDRCIEAPTMNEKARQAWGALWISSLLARVLGLPSACELPPWLEDTLVERFRSRLSGAMTGGTSPLMAGAISSQIRSYQDQIHEWLRWAQGRRGSLGIVVTGALARLAATTGVTWGVKLARELVGVSDAAVVVEGREGDFLLSRGAIVYAKRRLNGEPTYLDTLPQVSMIVTHMGEPDWLDLLESQWVQGGRTWETVPSGARFQLDRGQVDLELAVHREAAETCRRVRADLERRLDADCPVHLSISIEPGQGNPRVELVPEDASVLRGRSLLLDWQTAEDTGRTRSEELAIVERICPPLEPRLASANKWRRRGFHVLADPEARGIRWLVREYSQRQPSGWPRIRGNPTEDALPLLNRVLKEQVGLSDQRIATAVSSDCQVPMESSKDQDVLSSFVDVLDSRIAQTEGRAQLDVIRVLGSVSANARNLTARLRQFLKSPSGDQVAARAFLWACGNCLRADADIRLFFRFFKRGWLRPHAALAIANVLMYREQAPKLLSTSLAENLVTRLAPQIRAGHLTGYSYPIRYCSTAIAYILRRRCADPSFMAPGSEVYQTVKEAVNFTLGAEVPRLTPGVQRILSALRMIDAYLDRRGKGRPTVLLLDEES